ncbi:Putative class II aldolase/adducin [Septoria linicola]|uniref:Class II aldolase/adducin n=1 Tax=Septoria linicola TaxID=215465 RepID=A0A9Q9B193_9PEZI|nr:putative class II aldolase/adducin [Septoria linicola]USW59119.1 Putative class II aldolase/adducin [Septoria linicola]
MSFNETREALRKASTPPSKQLFSTLITANHILHYHDVVDAYGHISVRNLQNPNTFFISKSLAPALISSREDIEEYHVSDASPVNKDAPTGYQERFIHSEIYKKYPGVNSVVHAHNEAVLPFSIGSTPLKPVFHMAGTIGSYAPVFDISNHYKQSDNLHSLLVNNEHLGAGLAAGFSPSSSISKVGGMLKSYITSSQPAAIDFPPHPVVLMRGHGFTNVGATIEEAVFRAIFTCKNAQIQTTSLLMQGSFNLGSVARQFGAKEGSTEQAPQEGLKYLSEREVGDSWTQMKDTVERPWGLWSEEVRRHGDLYRNRVRDEIGRA